MFGHDCVQVLVKTRSSVGGEPHAPPFILFGVRMLSPCWAEETETPAVYFVVGLPSPRRKSFLFVRNGSVEFQLVGDVFGSGVNSLRFAFGHEAVWLGSVLSVIAAF